MPAVQRHVTAVAALALAMLVMAVGCSTSGQSTIATVGDTATVPDAPDPAADASNDSANDPANDTANDPATDTATEVASDVVQRPASLAGSSDAVVTGDGTIEEALALGDICGVYDGLADIDLPGADSEAMIVQLERIHGVMRRSAAFVPDDLAEDWASLAEGTTELIASIEHTGSHYDDAQYRSASQHVASWMDENCA